jgi:hypothetical protein
MMDMTDAQDVFYQQRAEIDDLKKELERFKRLYKQFGTILAQILYQNNFAVTIKEDTAIFGPSSKWNITIDHMLHNRGYVVALSPDWESDSFE